MRIAPVQDAGTLGRREVGEAVAIAALTTAAVGVVNLLLDVVRRRLQIARKDDEHAAPCPECGR